MNQHYYQGFFGNEIMNPLNFCTEIQEYFRMECSYIENLLISHRGYSAIVELGCDHMRLLPLAEKCETSYIGIDSRRTLKEINRQQCQQADGINARYICAEIESFITKIRKRSRTAYPRLLTILPFNLIGNLRKPFELCQHLLALGSELVISSFNPTENSAIVRSSYYNKCGLSGKLFELSDYGHMFYDSSCEFTSISMYPDFLRTKLETRGYVINNSCQCDLCYIMHVVAKSRMI